VFFVLCVYFLIDMDNFFFWCGEEESATVDAAETASGEAAGTKHKKKKDTLKPREVSLLERLNSYDSGNVHRQYNLVHIPPGFEPMPCNPIFLDLAAPEFPDLSHRCGGKVGKYSLNILFARIFFFLTSTIDIAL
jgi:hypothetical protein